MNSRTTLAFLVVLVLGLASFGFAQTPAQPHSTHRTLGWFDPATGSFDPLHSAYNPEVPPVTPTTGTLTYKFTITAKTAIPKNAVISCSVDIGVEGDSSGFSSAEHASGVATGSGTAYTCSAVLNYSWLLSSASTDKIEGEFTVSTGYGYEVTATNGTATLVVPATARSTTQVLTPISVPASGASTTVDVSSTE